MMENDYFFMRNIRKALGLIPENARTTADAPGLFAAADNRGILSRLRNRTAAERDVLVELLQENARALSIHLHQADSEHEAAKAVIDIIRNRQPEFSGTKHVILHDHPDVAALQLWKQLDGEAVTVHTTFGSDQELREKTIASFVGITAPAIGVADSATMIQLTRPGQPRSTSLVPSIHIALLRLDRLVADLEEAYALLQEESGQLDSLVFISGPSKTADIEATMVYGAHGPREMHLVLMPPAAALPATARA
jgi:L-lactate dehydrogenase complex protein LldG